jgi:hypothetical protein
VPLFFGDAAERLGVRVGLGMTDPLCGEYVIESLYHGEVRW